MDPVECMRHRKWTQLLRLGSSGVSVRSAEELWHQRECTVAIHRVSKGEGDGKKKLGTDRRPAVGDVETDDDSPGARTKKYYLMSRFMFAFLLIALFFAVCSFFTGLLALFSRLGGAMSGALAATALLFHSAAAALMTYVFVDRAPLDLFFLSFIRLIWSLL